jgi:hypothetical protein
MTDAPTHKNLANALAAFQAHLPTVNKGQTARIPGKEGKSGYSYDYADLTDVSAAVLPALAAQGLAWVTALDTTENGAIVLNWWLLHGESGESLTGSVPVGRPGEQWQSLGSSVTYARRYCLIAVTGVAPGGDDNDGEGARAGADPNREAAPNGGTPVPRERAYLPLGLYDLASLTTRDATLAMFRKAKAAGHLALLVGVTDDQGTVTEQEFGQYLIALGSTFPNPEADEAAAVAAHEAEVAAKEAAEATEAQVAAEGAGAFPTDQSEVGK